MPYTPAHKARTRERIVDSARRLFNRDGFAGVSIDELMADAGLTRGGFYNHFGNKEDLYAEVVKEEAKRWSGHEAVGNGVARDLIAAYLSEAHFDSRDDSCPLMAFASDVARGGEPVKRAYRQVLEAMVGVLEQGLEGRPDGRERAMALAALCIGGMAVARAVDDVNLAHELRESAKRLALSIAGQTTRPQAEAAE
ncbi:MAG: TetR/AcrR family transcriptional regulator [Methyloceanibacter sp.]